MIPRNPKKRLEERTGKLVFIGGGAFLGAGILGVGGYFVPKLWDSTDATEPTAATTTAEVITTDGKLPIEIFCDSKRPKLCVNLVVSEIDGRRVFLTQTADGKPLEAAKIPNEADWIRELSTGIKGCSLEIKTHARKKPSYTAEMNCEPQPQSLGLGHQGRK